MSWSCRPILMISTVQSRLQFKLIYFCTVCHLSSSQYRELLFLTDIRIYVILAQLTCRKETSSYFTIRSVRHILHVKLLQKSSLLVALQIWCFRYTEYRSSFPIGYILTSNMTFLVLHMQGHKDYVK